MSSNPRIGLPTNPRSRSTMRSRDDSCAPRHHENSEPRSRSVSRPNRGRSRERTEPTPPLPDRRQRQLDTRLQRVQPRSSASDESSSSTVSSIDRMKLGNSCDSSRMRIDEDYQSSKSSAGPDDVQPQLLTEKEAPLQDDKAASGGYTIWSSVASVASTLTISVSKAWAANISTYAGEETPAGQESRLTRAMKAYHIGKARQPTDLPTWLFDANAPEKAGFDEPSRREVPGESTQQLSQPANEVPKSRGLREIYDNYKAEAPIARPTRRASSDDSPITSKAEDRLKALRRDLRRAGSMPRASDVEETRSNDSRSTAEPRDSGRVTPRPRVGLPSGPRRA